MFVQYALNSIFLSSCPITKHIIKKIQHLFEFVAKEKQIKAIKILMHEKKNLILITKTDFDKNIVFQTMFFMFFDLKIALIIMFLNTLMKKQCQKLNNIKNCKSIVLNNAKYTQKNLLLIRQNKFIHDNYISYDEMKNVNAISTIFINPEIAVFKRFNEDVLKHFTFYLNLCLMAVNKIHIINDWKSFRSECVQIDVFCAKLFFNVSLLNASATLNPDIFEKIQKQCGFMSNCAILKTSLNRQKIYLQIICFKKTKISMLNFQHILFK